MSTQSPGSDDPPPKATTRLSLGLPTPSLTEAFAKRTTKINIEDKEGPESGKLSAFGIGVSPENTESLAPHRFEPRGV